MNLLYHKSGSQPKIGSYHVLGSLIRVHFVCNSIFQKHKHSCCDYAIIVFYFGEMIDEV